MWSEVVSNATPGRLHHHTNWIKVVGRGFGQMTSSTNRRRGVLSNQPHHSSLVKVSKVTSTGEMRHETWDAPDSALERWHHRRRGYSSLLINLKRSQWAMGVAASTTNVATSYYTWSCLHVYKHTNIQTYKRTNVQTYIHTYHNNNNTILFILFMSDSSSSNNRSLCFQSGRRW